MKSSIFGISRVPGVLNVPETASLTGRGRGAAATLAAAALVLVLSLTACEAQDTLAAQARAGDGKNYIAGDGSVTEYSMD